MSGARSERRFEISSLRVGSLVVLAALSSIAWPLGSVADVVHLKAGRLLEGEVRRTGPGGMVEVRLGGGTVVRLSESDILRIEEKPSPTELFDARFESVPDGEIEPLVELLVLAREKRLRRRAKKAAERILKMDANHELARWTLGYVVFRNRWMLDTELRKKDDLVRVDGEWMTKEDQKRREQDEARREVEELLTLVESENRRIRSYALKELGRRVKRRDLPTIDVLGERLSDRRVAVRLIAVAELGHIRVGRDASHLRADRIARQLHHLAMSEKNPAVRQLLHGTGHLKGTLATFYPRESFRLALSASAGAEGTGEIERLAEILVTSVKKAWVPELCRAAGERNRAARLALQEIFQVDLGYEAVKWLQLWERRKGEFRDVE